MRVSKIVVSDDVWFVRVVGRDLNLCFSVLRVTSGLIGLIVGCGIFA